MVQSDNLSVASAPQQRLQMDDTVTNQQLWWQKTVINNGTMADNSDCENTKLTLYTQQRQTSTTNSNTQAVFAVTK